MSIHWINALFLQVTIPPLAEQLPKERHLSYLVFFLFRFSSRRLPLSHAAGKRPIFLAIFLSGTQTPVLEDFLNEILFLGLLSTADSTIVLGDDD